jgi:hypothetical protein
LFYPGDCVITNESSRECKVFSVQLVTSAVTYVRSDRCLLEFSAALNVTDFENPSNSLRAYKSSLLSWNNSKVAPISLIHYFLRGDKRSEELCGDSDGRTLDMILHPSLRKLNLSMLVRVLEVDLF